MRSYNPPPNAKPLDLLSPFLKVKRANDHIRNLSEKRVAFMANRYFGIPKFNAETNITEFVLQDVPKIDPDIRLLLGDIAHNLRTALDHLACELARSVGVSEPRVYFPICETAEIYIRDSPGKTPGIPPEAKDFIDNIRPYGGHDDFLWGLHELDRIDKHRLVLTTTAKTGGWSITADQTSRNYGFSFCSELDAGTVIGDVEGNHESDKQMTVTPDIAFGEPGVLKGEALFPVLPVIARHVEEILLMFGANPLLDDKG